MQPSSDDVRRRTERFKSVCRDAGIKLTHQRMEIFHEIARTGDHPDVDTIYRGVRERLPTVSQDTVYRTLWMLNDLGLVSTIGTSRERTRFDANLDQHHHFVCVECGLMQDVYSESFNDLKPPESIGDFGRAISTHIEIRGVCHRCASNKTSDDN